MRIRFKIVSCAILLFSVACHAQVQPCPSGTLANVLGTTCSIGNITYTFGPDFHGFNQTVDLNNVFTTNFFGPEAIGFVPVTADNQSGFQLISNFVDKTNGTGLNFSQHAANFSYGLKANDASEVVSETGTVVGNVSQVFITSIGAFDHHFFKNQSTLEATPNINFVSFGGGLSTNTPETGTLAIPGITADINDSSSGLGFTTELQCFAEGGDDANLSSATFVYTTAPRVPTPPAGNFQFQNIDLPGAQSTFANGINSRGQIAGFFQDFAGNIHGYIADGSDFHTVDFPNASLTVPTAISNSGNIIVGGYSDASGRGHGFTFENGVFSNIDFPGAIFTSIIDINDKGDLAGVYLLPHRGGVHGFVRDQNGFTTVDFPGQNPTFPFTQAFGINNRENVIGTFLDNNFNTHGFSVFQGVFQQLDVPGAGTTSPEGVNEKGTMAGIYTDLDNLQHGYVQRQNSFVTLDFPGAVGTTIPFQINNSDTIVGNYIDDQGNTHSFLANQLSSGQAAHAMDTTPRRAPVQPCSPADWVRHPEKMRIPGTCHSDIQ